MRLILALLALANLRWGTACLVRSDRLMREADVAQDEAQRFLDNAARLADRAGLPAC